MKFFLACVIFVNYSFNAQTNRGVVVEYESESVNSGRYHAIIISENEYQDDKINDLNEPKNDADKLSSILVSKYFFKQDDIIRLVDPSRANILDAIEQKRKSLSIDDNLIIFYAGHGYWDE